jgi:hypothetical protein
MDTHTLERWEYDLAKDLMAALLADDRERFDESLASLAADRTEVHADLIVLGLTVAQTTRFRFPIFHRRPTPTERKTLIESLAGTGFADLIDVELAHVVLHRLYQRAFVEPVIPSIDLISMTTCLAIGAHMLWNHGRGRLPRDPHRRWDLSYRSMTAAMRLRRLSAYQWLRTDPPETPE